VLAGAQGEQAGCERREPEHNVRAPGPEAIEAAAQGSAERAHPYYQENLRGRDLDSEGWLQVLAHNPGLLKAPIALHGDRAVLCEPASLINTINEAQRKAG
jgi:hypothetical protein